MTIQPKTKLYIKTIFQWNQVNENAKFTNQLYHYSNNHVHTFSKLNKKIRNRFQNENENIFHQFSIFDDRTLKWTKYLIWNFEFDFNYHVAFTNNILKFNFLIFFTRKFKLLSNTHTNQTKKIRTIINTCSFQCQLNQNSKILYLFSIFQTFVNYLILLYEFVHFSQNRSFSILMILLLKW